MSVSIRELPAANWQEAQDLFFEALDRAPEERLEYVRAACAGRPEIRPYVELLVERYESDPDYLSRPVLDLRPDEPLAPLATGFVLSERFRIEAKLGEGGMGDVYSATDLELGVRVALKRMNPALGGSEETIGQFKQEIALAQKVTHRSICRVIDFHTHESAGHAHGKSQEIVLYLTMELLEGENLWQRIRREGPIAEAPARLFIDQICDGLSAAHDLGIIHRDLKPSNIMLVSGGNGTERAVILDFGLALNTSTAMNRPNAAAGTPAYMSPEQKNRSPLTPASDMFALGVVMHEMLTGRLPAPGPALTQLVHDARSTGWKASGHHTASNLRGLPKGWARAILACLEPAPEKRIQSAAELKAVLGLGVTRRRWVAGMGLAVAGGALASAGWFGYNASRRPYTPTPAAEYHYKLGLEYARRSTPTDIKMALSEFEMAVAIDPQFAQAWADLADQRCTAANFSVNKGHDARQGIEEAARKAIALDSSSAKAHAALAYALSIDIKRWKSAEQPLRQAVALDPKDPTARSRLAAFLGRWGKHEEAISVAQSAVRLEPGRLGINLQLATELFRAQRFTEIVELASALTMSHPNDPEVYLQLCRAQEWLHNFEEAERALATALSMPRRDWMDVYRVTLLAAKGQRNEARAMVEAMGAHLEGSAAETNELATVYAAIQDDTRLFGALDQGIDDEDETVLAVPTNPYLAPFREDSRFARFLSRLGF